MATATHPVLDLSELKEGQMKQVPFPAVEGGQILLSNVGGQINATSAFCTHYGAPLAKGVLTSTGRLVCPWHGACFNACTGDIEDAPAPNALHKFDVKIVDGKIEVTAQPEWTTKKEMARSPPIHIAERNSNGVVIVGGGSGAFYTLESLRSSGYQDPVTILSKENYVPIDRPKLSKSLMTDPSKLQWKSPAELHTKYGATIRLGTEVTSISASKKSVTLDGGKETLPYDKLVLAPGAIARRLPIPGGDFDNVYTFRSIEDSVNIDAAAKEGKDVVVIGSSFISMELVAVLMKRNLGSISVIGMEDVPFERVLGKEVGSGIQKFFESQSVKFYMKHSIKKINPTEGEGSKTAASVEIANASEEGVTLKCDFVVLGVGVRPATDFLKESGAPFTLESDGGIKVDEYMRLPGSKDIYAVGDIAHYKQPNGEYARIEHWNVAGNQGRCVGYNIAHNDSPQVFDKVPVFWSAQGQQLRYCGNGFGYEEVIVKGNPDDMKFIAYYVKQGKIVAVASMQNDPLVMKYSELMRAGGMPTPEEIRNL